MSEANVAGFSRASALWILTLRVLAFVHCTSVEGKPRVIGSSLPILAAPGDDVILPCHLDPPVDVRGLTVEWSKPDLKPDPSDRLSRVGYVHLYRDKREDPDMKIPSYVGRTALFTDDLKRGNISLKIVNVTHADDGRYRCFIPKLRSKANASIIRLVVDPNLLRTGTTEAPLRDRGLQTPDPEDGTDGKDGRSSPNIWILPVVVCSSLSLAAAAVVVGGYFLIRRHRKRECVKYEVAPSSPLPA